ncbi:hypothetical protein [Rhizobium sp. L1K21]|uniref:hypothetical protein n=1 Tax=Rhizobium sp. L1K21 TaxID=2954933 RepID=UPI002092A6F0|nr:hypothetical protein [Rhizobium sp. L1K21]MCO6188115.1 hypothetical protein [Rhizobium sp. L1K21]
MKTNDLIGVGLYTPSEAGKLLKIPAARLSRWLGGHKVGDRSYPALWRSEVSLGDNKVYLGFRDLMEARVANAFMNAGVSAIKVRSAILTAREIIGETHPLSTNKFRTDGREIFLQTIERTEDGEDQEKLLNLFRRQYEFNGILEPVLKSVDFGDDGLPTVWWPIGRKLNIVVDPKRSFGQPIDARSNVPAAILANAVHAEGSVAAAAKAYDVSEGAVRNAVEFQSYFEARVAA